MRVLLVDDSRTIRSIQKNVLAEIGYTDVAEAADGAGALASIAADRPDLVLVDRNMPNMDGTTLVSEIRKVDPALPIIICATEPERPRVVEALKAGANSYIIKPFTADVLSDRIRQTLAKAAVPA